MGVHLVLVAAPVVAAGFLHVFKFSFLLWPFNLALPLLRHLPHVCIALRGASSYYAAQLRRHFGGLGAPPVGYQHLRAPWRSPDEIFSHTMIALIDISY